MRATIHFTTATDGAPRCGVGVQGAVTQKRKTYLNILFSNYSFPIFRPWLKEFAFFDFKIEVCMPKSPPGSLPEVWKRGICIKYDKIMFKYVFFKPVHAVKT